MLYLYSSVLDKTMDNYYYYYAGLASGVIFCFKLIK